MVIGGGGHEITPVAGSARRVRDGQPASLLNPSDYPVTAVCTVCGREICCNGWLLGEWHHTAEPD